MARDFCVSRTAAICITALAVILFLLCVSLIAVFPSLYNKQLHEQLSLVKGSTLYPMWRKLPIPIYEKLYFFNITNGDEFLEGGVKLNVSEVGPYTYRSTWVKENIRWYPNKTVSYQERRTNLFVPEMSQGTEEDEIFTLNGPMLTAISMVKDKNFAEKFVLDLFLKKYKEEIITQKSIKELAFSGYEDPIIKYGSWFVNLPFKNGVFSWLYDKNDTYDGTFTVYTGETGVDQLNVINKWNGNSKLTLWKNDSCNMINGSSGEMGPPLREDQTEFTFFQSLFCRSLTFTYTNDVVHHGLNTKRFAASEKVFGNETVNEENACFDTKPHLASGVQDISGCQFNAPVLMSFPHFYLADPSYLEQIDGLNPQSDAHGSHFDVEPRTGISINILIRAQLNLELEPVDYITETANLPKGVFPVLWFELDAATTEDLADFLQTTLNRPKEIVYGLTGSLIFVSLFLFIFGIIALLRDGKSMVQESKSILTDKEKEQIYSTMATTTPDAVYTISASCCEVPINSSEIGGDDRERLVKGK